MDLQTAIERAKSALEERVRVDEREIFTDGEFMTIKRQRLIGGRILADTEALQTLREWKPEENAEKYERLSKAYNELIMAVQRKFPGEIRHDTALRYIKRAEELSDAGPACQPNQEPS